MASLHWAGKNGDWSTKADWTGGVVPGAGDDVFFDGSTKFTATINSAEAAHSITISDASATVQDNAQLTLGGALSITAGTFQLDGNGTISGGTISASGGTLQWNGGALSGVEYDGPLNLAASSSSVTISSAGIVLKGAGGSGNGTVTLSGSGARLDLQGTQTLDNATVNLTASGAYLSQVSVGTLTLGANLTLNDTSASGFEGIRGGTSAGYAVINKGAINVTKSTASFYIYSENFTNQGNIDVSNGGTLHIDNATDGLAWSNAGQITASGGGRWIWEA